MTLRFHDFEIDPHRLEITKCGAPIAVERRVFDLIVYLVRHRDRVVSKEELNEQVWDQIAVSDSAIARCVSAARRALSNPDCIESAYGRGYRWMIPIVDAAPQKELPVRPPHESLFGRDRELELAANLARRASEGQGGSCLVIGEAGIGKTRFLEAVRNEATRRGMRVIVGKCRETEGTPAYWPWPKVVQAIEDKKHRVPAAVSRLLSITPDTTEATYSAAFASRILVWEALAEFIAGASRDTPTAILMDDLHSADAGSTFLLELVAERVRDAPLLLAVAYRAIELERDPQKSACVERIVRSTSPVALELRGLTPDDTLAFLHAQGLVPSPELARRAHELTGGNPFFLGLVTPLLGTLGQEWDARDVVQKLPGTVRASIETQLATVSRDCRAMLEVASVIGRVVRMRRAASALGCTVGEVSSRAHEAGSAGLVSNVDSGAFTFVHDLVREVIYESLIPPDRSRLHLAVAQSLVRAERVGTPEGSAEIAHHYAHAVESGGAERAVEYATRAAKSELERFAYEAARDHLRRSISLMDQWSLGDARFRCEVLIDLGRAELRSGNDGAAWEALERATSIARDLEDIDAMVRVALALTGTVNSSQMAFDPKLVALLEELIARTSRTNPKVRALLLSRLILTLAWFPGQPRRAALSEEARELVESIDDPRVRASVATARTIGVDQPGKLEDRLRLSEEAVRLSQLSEDLEVSQFAHVVRMLSLLEGGRIDDAREQARACRDVLRRLRSHDVAALCLPATHDGLFAYVDGRLQDLDTIAKGIESLVLATGNHFPKSIADVQRMFLLLERDEPATALELTRTWADLLPHSQPWQSMMTMVLARAGCESECRERLSAYTATNFELESDWHWLYSMAFLADACATMRDGVAASIAYDRLSPYGDRCITIGGACIFLGSVERYLGRLAEVLGRHDAADGHFERAHAVHSRSGARLMLAQSLADHVTLLERVPELGRGERAKELRGEATKVVGEIGSEYLRGRLAGASMK